MPMHSVPASGRLAIVSLAGSGSAKVNVAKKKGTYRRSAVARRPAAKRAARKAAATREFNRSVKQSVDRYIERWARRLILVDHGKVRKLTEEEVQDMANGSSSSRKPRRRATKPKARNRVR
jgi:hypothetical protein